MSKFDGESETAIYLKDKDGNKVTLHGNHILDISKTSITVPNLTIQVDDVTPADNFGESGDVFNHHGWRSIIALLWSTPGCDRHLMGIATSLFLRGKEFKVNNRGKSKVYKIPLPQNIKIPESLNRIIRPGSTFFPLIINFPTDQSRVQADALTLERFKCLTRIFIVPYMLKAGRFPAIAESIGFGDLVRGLVSYEAVVQEKIAIADAEEQTKFHEKSLKENEHYALWTDVAKNLSSATLPMMTSCAAVAGCISTKEIYTEDDIMWKGCIYWAGVHSFLNDITNRVKALSATAELRPRLENSAFYTDFKRKMVARGINLNSSPDYITFLKAILEVVPKYIRVGTLLNADESTLFDKILGMAQNTTKLEVKRAQAESEMSDSKGFYQPIQGTTSEDVMNAQKTWLMKIAQTEALAALNYASDDEEAGGSASKDQRPRPK